MPARCLGEQRREPELLQQILIVGQGCIIRPDCHPDATREIACERRDSVSETQVASRIAHDRGVGPGDHVDIGIGDPNAVGDGGARVHRAQTLEMAEHAIRVEFGGHGGLRRRLERMEVQAEPTPIRVPGEPGPEFIGDPLRASGPVAKSNPRMPCVVGQ